MAAKKKVTLYLPHDILEETRAEADRLDRTVSWVMQNAWRHARETLRRMPGVNDEHDREAG
jgi:uncharacterized small protein (TIGR04563 family)